MPWPARDCLVPSKRPSTALPRPRLRTSWARARPRGGWWTSTCVTSSAESTSSPGAPTADPGRSRGCRRLLQTRPPAAGLAASAVHHAVAAPTAKAHAVADPHPHPQNPTKRSGIEFASYMAGEGYSIIPISGQHQLEYACNVLNLGSSRIVSVHAPSARQIVQHPAFKGDVRVIDFSSVTSMYGSVHCASQVVLRCAFACLCGCALSSLQPDVEGLVGRERLAARAGVLGVHATQRCRSPRWAPDAPRCVVPHVSPPQGAQEVCEEEVTTPAAAAETVPTLPSACDTECIDPICKHPLPRLRD